MLFASLIFLFTVGSTTYTISNVNTITWSWKVASVRLYSDDSCETDVTDDMTITSDAYTDPNVQANMADDSCETYWQNSPDGLWMPYEAIIKISGPHQILCARVIQPGSADDEDNAFHITSQFQLVRLGDADPVMIGDTEMCEASAHSEECKGDVYPTLGVTFSSDTTVDENANILDPAVGVWYRNVGSVPGPVDDRIVDLHVTATDLGTTSVDTAKTLNGEFGMVNLDDQLDVNFKFVYRDNEAEPVNLDVLYMTFLDLDGNNRVGSEQVAATANAYFIPDNSRLTITETDNDDGTKTVLAKNWKGTADNPTEINNLNGQQKRVSITYRWDEVTNGEVDVFFKANSNGNARNIMFAGVSYSMLNLCLTCEQAASGFTADGSRLMVDCGEEGVWNTDTLCYDGDQSDGASGNQCGTSEVENVCICKAKKWYPKVVPSLETDNSENKVKCNADTTWQNNIDGESNQWKKPMKWTEDFFGADGACEESEHYGFMSCRHGGFCVPHCGDCPESERVDPTQYKWKLYEFVEHTCGDDICQDEESRFHCALDCDSEGECRDWCNNDDIMNRRRWKKCRNCDKPLLEFAKDNSGRHVNILPTMT